VTSIVVAATTSSISSRFDSFGRIGGIIGTSVSAAFLIFLGVMNGYVLYKLASRLRQVIRAEDDGKFGKEGREWLVAGGGPMFRVLSKLFRVVDRYVKSEQDERLLNGAVCTGHGSYILSECYLVSDSTPHPRLLYSGYRPSKPYKALPSG
jgi:hypothetical protein